MQKVIPDIYIGGQLRQLRINSHLTQAQVSEKLDRLGLNVSRSVYSRYENGTLNIPVSVLHALTDIFSCDYNAFFTR
jgi:transcriptional regulator with XRE-family HTH domain